MAYVMISKKAIIDIVSSLKDDEKGLIKVFVDLPNFKEDEQTDFDLNQETDKYGGVQVRIVPNTKMKMLEDMVSYLEGRLQAEVKHIGTELMEFYDEAKKRFNRYR